MQLCKTANSMREMKLAAEHEFGVYAKTVKNNDQISEEDKKYIFDQLMANFNGECSEVGMYLCMARIAHREGYPEIGLYWEKAAYEEAEHAAKFDELLGEVVTDSTNKILEMRVDAEPGATVGTLWEHFSARRDFLKCSHENAEKPRRHAGLRALHLTKIRGNIFCRLFRCLLYSH